MSPVPKPSVSLKICRGCGQVLPLVAFYSQLGRDGQPGARAVCKSCYRATYAERYHEKRPAAKRRLHMVLVDATEAKPYKGDDIGRNPIAWDMPAQWDEGLDELMGQTRRVNCRFYEHCLDVAVDLCWKSFSCEACPVRDEFSASEILEQSPGLMQLAKELR